MNRYTTWTALWFGLTAAGLWYAFGTATAAESAGLDQTTEPIRRAADEDQLHEAILSHIAALQRELGDEHSDLKLIDGLRSLETLRHRGSSGKNSVEDDEVNDGLTAFGSAVNEDLKGLATRIGSLNQSYEIPALTINGNGVSGTKHVDRNDGVARGVRPKTDGDAFGEATAELETLRNELRRLAQEVERLQALVAKPD